jgi:hypothetical protein
LDRVSDSGRLDTRSTLALVHSVGALWVGAVAVATAYDGPTATRAVAALLVVGLFGLALWRRRIDARVRNVHGPGWTVAAAVVIVGLLAIGLFGARSLEAFGLAWAPFASGGAVSAVVFVALEVLRRATQAKLAAGDA